MRWLNHLFARTRAEKHFPATTLDAIQHAIADSEHAHLGEICFAVEGGLPLGEVIAGRRARERAHEVFARLRVWDTAHNTGVLVYILLADHAIEIVADRGIAAKVPESEWRSIIEAMQRDFADGRYEPGAIGGVAAITAILARHFPAHGMRNADELPDRPVIL